MSSPGRPQTLDEVDLFDPATQEDWNPTYDLLRAEAPVWQMPGTDTFVLTRFDDIHQVLRQTDVFARGAREGAPGTGMSSRTAAIYAERGWPRLTPLAIDPPVHRRYRELVDPFFSVQGAERRRGLITAIVDELLDNVAGRGEMEYVADIAVPLPVRVITEVMGFSAEDIPQLKVWSEAWVLPFRGRLTEDEEVYAGERGVEFQHHIHATVEAKRAARTHCNVASPIGPAPCTTAVSPSRGGLDRTAWNATVNGSTWAACSSVRVGSVGTTREAATASRGAKPPWGGASASRPTADRKAT